ncbi:efflux RND transporter periplasmic adaptor subunit [Nibrella saemangeumensis]|uniref:Efflux RND transporter periplasmic adaptor subunit n=1 Tax=Nibrella saemangeumensis TaxID=1084526 RepID=A0ABP8NGN0_9BACT
MRALLLILIVGGALIIGKLFLLPKASGESKGKLILGPEEAKKKESKSGDKPPVKVDVLLVHKESVENFITIPGTVLPNESVELKAELSGRLNYLIGKEGKSVAKGELIARINDKELKAQLLKLDLQEQRAKEVETRQRQLLAVEGVSKEEFAIVANNTLTIGADKELLRAQLEKTEIRAPFSGKIGLRQVSEGAFLMPGTLVATLVQTNPVKIDFSIPEKYAHYLRVGTLLQLSTEGSESVSARIAAISPLVDPTLRTLKIRAIAPNHAGRLVPGMFVRVHVRLSGNNESILVPSQAVIPELKGKKVFLVKAGKAQEQFIKIGLRQERNVQVTEGLTAGDSVIVSSIMALRNGSPVSVKKTPSSSQLR